MQGSRKNLYMDILEELHSEISHPDVLVYLKCSEDILLERIRVRGRETENAISLEYLCALSESIDNNIKRIDGKTEVVIIDSESLDYA